MELCNTAHFMIVYTKTPDRLANYHAVLRSFPALRLFEALDTVSRKAFGLAAARAVRKRIVMPEFARLVKSQRRLGALTLLLSHHAICRAAQEPVLCFEDDVVLLDRAVARLAVLLGNLLADWADVPLEYRVSSYFFRLQAQWGCAAVLLSESGIAKFPGHHLRPEERQTPRVACWRAYRAM